MDTNPVCGAQSPGHYVSAKMGSAQRTSLSARTGSSFCTSQLPMVMRSREGGQHEFLANPPSLLQPRVYSLFQGSSSSLPFLCLYIFLRAKMANKHNHYRIQADITFRLLTSREHAKRRDRGESEKFLSSQHLNTFKKSSHQQPVG